MSEADIEPHRNFFQDFSSIIRADPLLSDTAIKDTLLTGKNGFPRAEEMLIRLGTSPEWFHGKVVVDIAGGSINTPDHEDPSQIVFAPIFGIAIDKLGGQPVVIDLNDLPSAADISNPLVQKLAQHIENSKAFTYVPMDLSKTLANPQQMVEMLMQQVPAIQNGVDSINCSALVSRTNVLLNSPAFMRAIGVDLDEQQTPLPSHHNWDIIERYISNIFSVAIGLLRDNGYLFFNEHLYRKVNGQLERIQTNRIFYEERGEWIPFEKTLRPPRLVVQGRPVYTQPPVEVHGAARADDQVWALAHIKTPSDNLLP